MPGTFVSHSSLQSHSLFHRRKPLPRNICIGIKTYCNKNAIYSQLLCRLLCVSFKCFIRIPFTRSCHRFLLPRYPIQLQCSRRKTVCPARILPHASCLFCESDIPFYRILPENSIFYGNITATDYRHSSFSKKHHHK